MESSSAIAAGPPPRSSRPARASLDLGAAAFLPIARDELFEAANQVRGQLWANPWFGRRDLIPPVDDPRTQLIDRGMVTQGLLSPEQLAEIHQVGAEMERWQPSLAHVEHQAARAGQAAVEADRARRAALKEQKKKEAALRKQRRREEVARRRAGDIFFLGRGVSGRLHLRQSDAQRLTVLGLPVLHTPADLAGALQLPIPKLRWLAFHTEVAARIHYVRFSVPRKTAASACSAPPIASWPAPRNGSWKIS